MTLEQLRVFVAVAEREHMTRAAAELRLAQSAVSATVSALEAEHGVRLFDRVGRNIRLTAGGTCLLAEARAVLNRAEQARRAVAACREAEPGNRSHGTIGRGHGRPP